MAFATFGFGLHHLETIASQHVELNQPALICCSVKGGRLCQRQLAALLSKKRWVAAGMALAEAAPIPALVHFSCMTTASQQRWRGSQLHEVQPSVMSITIAIWAQRLCLYSWRAAKPSKRAGLTTQGAAEVVEVRHLYRGSSWLGSSAAMGMTSWRTM